MSDPPSRISPGLVSPNPEDVAAAFCDIVVNAPCWDAEPTAEAIVRRAVATAAGEAGPSIPGAGLAVILTNDSEIRALNLEWRGLDKPTNVLSFPASAPPPDGPPPRLGDIVIAFETTRREAEEERKPFVDHLSHLAVHGFLHLVGHDHETDAEAGEMENLERRVLAALGIPDPYLLTENSDK